MSDRKPKKTPHRLVPVWRAQLDREGFARALLLLAMHLDETERMRHKKQQNEDDGQSSEQQGGGS